MEVVGSSQTVLLLARQTILATPADTTPEPDPDDLSGVEVVFAIRAESHDASHALVSAYVRKLDAQDGVAVGAGCGA